MGTDTMRMRNLSMFTVSRGETTALHYILQLSNTVVQPHNRDPLDWTVMASEAPPPYNPAYAPQQPPPAGYGT